MSNFGYGGYGFSLKALLEDPNLQNPPALQPGKAVLLIFFIPSLQHVYDLDLPKLGTHVLALPLRVSF